MTTSPSKIDGFLITTLAVPQEYVSRYAGRAGFNYTSLLPQAKVFPTAEEATDAILERNMGFGLSLPSASLRRFALIPVSVKPAPSAEPLI